MCQGSWECYPKGASCKKPKIQIEAQEKSMPWNLLHRIRWERKQNSKAEFKMNIVLYVYAWVAVFVCSDMHMHTGIYCTCGLLFLPPHTLPAPRLPVTLMRIIQCSVRFSKCISKNNSAHIVFIRKLHVHSNNSSSLCLIWQSAKKHCADRNMC